MSKKMADMKTKKAEHYLRLPYARVLIPEAEGGYAAEILEFPGCYSQGENAKEALENLEDAALNWLEAAISAGQRIPEPSDSGDASGKVALRLPRNLHRKATQMADRERVSLNTFLIDAIATRVGAGDFYGRLLENLDNRSTGFGKTFFVFTATFSQPLFNNASLEIEQQAATALPLRLSLIGT